MKKTLVSKGTIFSRSPGSWSFRLETPTTTGTRQKLFTVKGSLRDAERRRVAIMAELVGNKYVSPAEQPLAAYLGEWLRISAPIYRPRTLDGYHFIVRKHIEGSQLGRTRIGEIAATQIQKLLSDKMASGLSPRSVRHIFMVLRSALRAAVKGGLLRSNPCDAVTAPRCSRYEAKTLSSEQVSMVLKEAESTSYATLFNLGISTGCRRSELLALRWCDVDLALGEISVRHSLYTNSKGESELKDTKTKSSTRLIPLPPSAWRALTAHYEALQAKLDNAVKSTDFVFTRDGSRPLLGNSVSHAWFKLMRRLGFEGVTFHSGCRHTHATLLLKGNTHPKIVCERLGHSTISTTLDLYSHVSPTMSRLAALRFDELIQPCAENPAQASGIHD